MMNNRPITKAEPLQRIPEWAADSLAWRSFAFYSANMRYLMPNVPVAFHAASFEETQLLRAENADSLLAARRLGEMPAPLSWRGGVPFPAIVATFHTGPYPLVCGWLMQHRIPFALLLSADVLQRQELRYRQLYRQITGVAPDEKSFVCIDASDPRSLFRMRTVFNQGMVLVAYLDGNTGVPLPRGTAPRLVLDFMGRPMAAKVGVAFIAHLTGVPVYPLACYRAGNGVRWLEGAKVEAAKGEVREAYVKRCMATSYGVLEALLLARAPQWEGWLYVHHDLLLDPPSQTKLPTGLQPEAINEFMPFQIREHYFVLHTPTFATYRIPRRLHDELKRHADIFFCI
ncbi:hypothetical protein GCM10007415_25140 [Parapedobacter pyrenivorans]|uniref:Lauroyl/myristoyl acyltransferase n=1 Tax=Parapedobacter pyrenivorans TaxID=1305674 RepID=A0A917HVJ7_9SPHI|nr:hypothetical protein [Parapedobacter pyrenivorans]GGG89832.1 hypothetical protein GCM10007415_25140 [Parapedobacter pyrenivorans]